jgi:hypothetical protein
VTLLSGYRRGVDSCPLAEAVERFDLAVCGLVVKERLLVGVGSREKGEAFAHGTARNDGLIWPHCDGLNWPHLVRSSAEDRVFIEHGIGAAESGIQSGAVRADQA